MTTGMGVRIGVLGATGRMGCAIIQALRQAAGMTLTAAFERPGHAALGRDAGVLAGGDELGVVLTHDLVAAMPDFDVLVDFTRPEGTLAALAVCALHGKALVTGTTGLDPLQKQKLVQASQQIPVVQAANFSIGVNVCLSLIEQAARVLGEDFDIEIVEAHHRHKVDAPSGTALAMGEAAARGAAIDLNRHAVYARQGHTGERERSAIGFSTVRGGDVVGDHTVLFLGDGERVEIGHRATNRLNFAHGAVRAAAWLRGRAPGLYTMRDVLGL